MGKDKKINMKPLNIIIVIFFGLAITVMLYWPGPVIPPSPPEPPLAITPVEYENLLPEEKRQYGRWEWQDVVFWCPHCRVQYTLPVKPRTEYFLRITDYNRPRYFTTKAGGHGCYWPNLSPWLIQLTVMQDEEGKSLVIKCQKCGKVFRLPWYRYGVPSRIPVAGVSGYRQR